MVAAAGRGERLSSAQSKAFVMVAGRPLVSHALEAFRACEEIEEIVLVVPAEEVERARRELLRPSGGRSERVVAGGAERQASVAAALAELGPDCDVVLVHDGARPFVRPELIRRCLEGAREHGAVAAAVPATDTVKEAGEDGVVRGTLDRSKLWLVQTPQAFRREVVTRAYEVAEQRGLHGTDDASLVESCGYTVHVVMGDRANIKVTWPEDVALSEHLMGREGEGMRAERAMRVGVGFDAHRFAEDKPLVLAGVRIREKRGLLGHSDADVACHAICDALLGAAAGGDIGGHFPDSDPSYAGISSLALLTRSTEVVRGKGWEIENVDAVIIAEEPRVGPRVREMREALAAAMGVEVDRVNVKGKTTEGMGFAGRGEGIASEAVAMLRRGERKEG